MFTQKIHFLETLRSFGRLAWYRLAEAGDVTLPQSLGMRYDEGALRDFVDLTDEFVYHRALTRFHRDVGFQIAKLM